MRLNDYRAVVFDLDDTLYLERDYVRSGFRAVGQFLRRRYQWPQWRERQFVTACGQKFEAGERGNIFNSVLAQCDFCFRPPAVEELVRAYREHAPRIALQPDAQALLEELQGCSDVWIITDGSLASQQAKVTALGLMRRVRRVVYTDHWGREFWKPHRRAFDQVQADARAHGRDCIYIADNPAKDFRTPRQLGWSTLRVRRAQGLHARCDVGPDDAPDDEMADFWPLLEQAGSLNQGRTAFRI